MPARDHASPIIRLVTACGILASLGACAGELYPEAPAPARSAAPGVPTGSIWQTVATQIQTRPTVLGDLTFTPFTRSDDPSRVQFLLAIQPDETSGLDPLEGGTGTLDLLPRSGPSTRLTLAPGAGSGLSGSSGLVAETRLTTGQTTSVTARLNVRGVSISANFTFTAL